ncbi:MAG TPA: diaminopimelate decarboxylase [Candidatus Hydrogenedentes bacterium]|nr:diaminopimelate decarboxylase [Candidatus Hydrogenedentota bacterium]
MDSLVFFTEAQVREVQRAFGTPVYVYDERTFERRAREMLAFPNAYGLTVRYAMKALSSRAVLRLFDALGLHIDASSGFEAERALRAGIAPEKVQITAQEPPRDLKGLVEQGVRFNACSIHQLDEYGKLFPGAEVSVRINPGLGSGHSNRTNVGGPSSSFGIWHEHLDYVLGRAARHGLRLTRMHTHIGSGTDPETWLHCARLSLAIAARMPEVTLLSLGGGFKVARMPDECSADVREIGGRIAAEFERFAREHGRELHLEVEPGTYLVANAGALVCTAIDVVDTGPDGFRFLKLDAGMTDIMRPSMYGAWHPIVVVPASDAPRGAASYIVAGHCCESGDILTPERGNPEGLAPRELREAAIGDAVVIEGAGAYCAAQCAKNYNSFPEAPEVLLTKAGEFRLIRRRQTMEQMLENEIE